ncbi:TetR/AcrR family transcriptional regulator [Acrocarpospora macrocephala]|uniref:Putative transcriptional regulator TetR family protein n=1 Tax=Acrocarpospora macrocephala TaxID=150177 RepID=A0A5M3WQ32_9ACTN|nr:TetR/AcrR family transcriptional regulator [Acrocarpospora macrocephala]GES10299.1 putative transcriptional regulator TetR family protein [Acrocarpospora macrocephala]
MTPPGKTTKSATGNRRKSTGSPIGQARKESVLLAAAKVFAEKGFSSATVRDVADEAGMLSGSLYYYFDSKEAIVEQVLLDYLDTVIREYRAAVADAAGPAEALRELMARALLSVARNRYQVLILQNDWHYVQDFPSISRGQNEIAQIWMDVIDAGMAGGVFRKEFSARMVYRTVMGAVQAIIRWFDPDGPITIDEIIHIETELLLNGVNVPAP